MFLEEKVALQDLMKKVIATLDAPSLKKATQELEALKRRQDQKDFFEKGFEVIKEHNQKVKKLEKKINPWFSLRSELEDLITLREIAEEEKDSSYESEIRLKLNQIKKNFQNLETRHLFKEQTDEANCYLTIQAGAGGTESCDWAAMLYRLYHRWAERKQMNIKLIDYQAGEEAGVKSSTLLIEGLYAYGQLKSENGVHRLVRISPFDANKKRHTSFASLGVVPELENEIEVQINPSELRIDTYRASGAGGQHVNTTDSAVRITHLPTHIVVSCQAERSQHQNKEQAMRMLKAKLYEHQRQINEAEKNAKLGEKKKIEWGSQIRSYVFHPYNMIKDHRTQHETAKVDSVMDGDIDEFILAYLKMQ